VLIFEAIFTLLRRSLGSVLRAMFGWATLALFGEVREKERSFLTVVVAAAAVWPLLLVGTVFPRQAALVLAVLPIPEGTPESIMRGVWIALTILIPLSVGWALSRRNAAAEKRAWWKGLLLGFPTTLGIGLGFLFVCVAVPARKLSALASGRKEEHVALAIAPDDYSETVARLREALRRGGIPLERRETPWSTRALGRLLHVFAGAVLRTYQPQNLEYLCANEIEMTFYPNGIRLYGSQSMTARAHALIAESATDTPAMLCMAPEGQEIEHRIKALWKRRREANVRLDADVRAVARELSETTLGFQDWETLYRQLLQVLVASRGASRLLQTALAGTPGTAQAPGADERRRRAGAKRLRGAARRARAYGGNRLRKEASDGSLKLIEKLAERMLGILTGRR
jgi:hypothetical protein